MQGGRPRRITEHSSHSSGEQRGVSERRSEPRGILLNRSESYKVPLKRARLPEALSEHGCSQRVGSGLTARLDGGLWRRD